MNKQDLVKIQTCVLRVNIHCEGCMHKVKKKLQKVEGVYKVNIDAAQGKVTVSGNVDPLLLIEKLEKAGKHAELWGPQKGQGPIPMPNSLQFGNVKEGKGQKGGFQVPQGKGQKGGFQLPQGKGQNGGFQLPQGKGQNGGFQVPPELQAQMQMMMNQKKGVKDEKSMGKDQKSVKFKLPEEDEDDDYEDDSEEFDDDDYDYDYDDESDDDFAHQPPAKAAHGGHGQQAKKATADGHSKGDKNGGKGKKKGGGINMLFKSMLGKAGGKNGGKKGEIKKDDGGKNGKKNGGGEGKHGAAIGKSAPKNGGGKGNDKKGGDDFNLGFKMEGKQKGLGEMNANHKGGGGGGGDGGRNMEMMGQMGGFPAVQGLPAGRMQGMMGQGNPYSQQQHMAQMMMMNGQNAYNRPHPPMGYGPPQGMGYGPPQGMGYGPPPPQAMGYGPPPPPGDNYTHMFNDENTDSCSIM